MKPLLESLLSHRNQAEGILWKSLIDTTAKTVSEIDPLKPAINKLQSRGAELSDVINKLAVEELRVRVALANRFDREFPSAVDYMERRTKQPAAYPSNKELMRQLLGRTIDKPHWSFDSLEEFKSFEITTKNERKPVPSTRW
jgi:hypothetical protein